MAVYEFEGKQPLIDPTAYIFETAAVIGNVKVGKKCFVGPGAIIRGDYGLIYIDDYTSVQDNAVIHALDKGITWIGQYVQIAHSSTLHNCFIFDYCIIGNNATINDHAKILKWAIVAPGAVVPARKVVMQGTIVAGNPAKFLRDLRQKDKDYWMKYKNEYPGLAFPRYPKGLKRIG